MSYTWLLPQIDGTGKFQSKYVADLQFQSDYQFISATNRFKIICQKVIDLLAKSKDDWEFWQGLNVPAYVEFVSLKVKNIDNQNTFVDLVDKNGNVYIDLFHFSLWSIQGVSTYQEKWDNEQKFYTTQAHFFILCDFLLQQYIDNDYSFAGVEPLAYYTKSVTDEKIQVLDDKFNNYYDETYIDTELKKINDKFILLSNAIGSSNSIISLSDNVVNLLSVINTLAEKIDTLVSTDDSTTTEQNNNTKIDETQFAELKALLKSFSLAMLKGV